MLIELALRNLGAHIGRNGLIAVLLTVSSFFAVVGLTLTQSVKQQMQNVVQGNFTGDLLLQVRNPDKVNDLFFGGDHQSPSVIIPDHDSVMEWLREKSEIEAFLPLGIADSRVSEGNHLDQLIEAVRLHGRAQLPALNLYLADLQDHAPSPALSKALSPAFQTSLQKLEEEALAFLENEVAPLDGPGTSASVHYIAADPRAYLAFYRKARVDSPTGQESLQKGVLLSRDVYDKLYKLKIVKQFETLSRKIKSNSNWADDTQIQAIVKKVPDRAVELLGALYPEKRQAMLEEMSSWLMTVRKVEVRSWENDLALVQEFLKPKLSQLPETVRWFEQHVLPVTRVHSKEVGDSIVIENPRYLSVERSLALPLAGILSFEGLEKSPFTAGLSLVDAQSFAALMDDPKENREVRPVAFDENQLFGGDIRSEYQEKKAVSLDATIERTHSTRSGVKPPVMAIAIRLKSGVDAEAFRNRMLQDIRSRKFSLTVVPWDKAAGTLSQLVGSVLGGLLLALAFLLLLSFLLMSNSIVVSSVARTRELGTLLALGASRGFIKRLFAYEAGALSILAWTAGGCLAWILLRYWNSVGIPASQEALRVLFSGDRLFPALHWSAWAWAGLGVLTASVLAAWFTTSLAVRVEPIHALQEQD